MPQDRRSFFEKLTGSVNASQEDEAASDDSRFHTHGRDTSNNYDNSKSVSESDLVAEEEEGQLAVDMFQSPSEIAIQAVVAGVRPDELDVSITQDMVTIRGKRQKQREIAGDDYYYQELYWGTFSRSIMLPQEVDAEESEATLKNGILTIKLPKLDKNRIQKLKIKNE